MLIDDNIVKIEKEDWENGLAHQAIDILQSERSEYDKKRDLWIVSDETAYTIQWIKDNYDIRFKRYIKDIKKAKETVSGLDMDGNISLEGIARKISELKDLKQLLLYMKENNADRETLEMFNNMVNEKIVLINNILKINKKEDK